MNKKNQVAITLGLMCFILTALIVVQVNTINNANSAIGQARNENDLRDEVLKWKEKYDVTYSNLEKAEKNLENLRQNASNNDETTKQMEEELKTANKLLGLTELTGDGIVITLEDGTDLIHQEDLIYVVNELKNAGAEAISINGQRLVSTSFISCDGNVILINGNKIGTPFVVQAIGYPSTLYGALMRNGGYLEKLQDIGIKVETKKVENIVIQKYNGIIDSKYMKVVE